MNITRVDLRFDCIGAHLAGVTDHPQRVMQDFGIKYVHATPQSIADQWWFWGCSDVPDTLPDYIKPMDHMHPFDFIGFGLSLEDAEKIDELGD